MPNKQGRAQAPASPQPENVCRACGALRPMHFVSCGVALAVALRRNMSCYRDGEDCRVAFPGKVDTWCSACVRLAAAELLPASPLVERPDQGVEAAIIERDGPRFTLMMWFATESEARAALSASRPTEAPRPTPHWQPIDTAPKGSWPAGPDDVRHPDYVEPPHVWLLLPDGQRCVGSHDAYYAEGGNGYDGDSAWVEEFSGERVRPTHWMPLPPAPRPEGAQEK